jgi:hypothetical protein
MSSPSFDLGSIAPAWLPLLAAAAVVLGGLLFAAVTVAALAYFKGRRAALIGAGVLLLGGGFASATLLAALYLLAADAAPAAPPPAPVAVSPARAALDAAQADFNRAEFSLASASFARARDLDPTARVTVTEISAHLLAHRGSEAARSAQLFARFTQLSPEKTSLAECLAAALAARNGDVAAQHQLSAQTELDRSPLLCGALAADLEGEPRAKKRRLARLQARPSSGRPGHIDFDQKLVHSLSLEARAPLTQHPVHTPVGLAALAPEAVLLLQPLAVRHAMNVYPAPDAEIEAVSALAIAHSWLSEHRSAANALRRVLSLTVGGDSAPSTGSEEDAFRYQSGVFTGYAEGFARNDRVREGLFLASALALRAGYAGQAQRYVEMNTDDSWGRPKLAPYQLLLESRGAKGAEELTREDSTRPNWELWTRAANQDAPGLVELLTERRHTGSGLFPWVVGDWSRAALTDWLRNKFPTPPGERGFHDVLRHTAARREAARALGDKALEAELGSVVERLMKAWLDRDAAVPLHVLARLANF